LPAHHDLTDRLAVRRDVAHVFVDYAHRIGGHVVDALARLHACTLLPGEPPDPLAHLDPRVAALAVHDSGPVREDERGALEEGERRESRVRDVVVHHE
jgi:hypothetical protein